jgi:hypothetical protein
MTVLATATATEQPSVSTPEAVNCHNQSVALGAGLGVPLGFALLLAALLAYRLFNLRHTRTDQNTDMAHKHSEKASPANPAELGGLGITELPGSGK